MISTSEHASSLSLKRLKLDQASSYQPSPNTHTSRESLEGLISSSNLTQLGLNFNTRLFSSLSEEEGLSSEGRDKGHRSGPRARLTREEG